MQEHISLCFLSHNSVGTCLFFYTLGSRLILRAFHFPTKFSFRSFQSLLCKCSNIVWKISRTYTPNKLRLISTNIHSTKMLIHYNTKILILWRHTPIQWKFIWQHFWTLEYCRIEHSIPFPLFLWFLFFYINRENSSFWSVYTRKANYVQFVCATMVIVFISVHGSINVFEICFDRRRRKKNRMFCI